MKRIAIITSLILASAAHAQTPYWMIQPSQSNQILQQQLESQQRTEAMVRQMQADQEHERSMAELRELRAESDRIRAEGAAQRAKEERQQACVYWVTSPPVTREKLNTWCSRVK